MRAWRSFVRWLKHMKDLADNPHGRGMAVLGESHGPCRECTTPCLSCGELVMLLMPAAPVRGQVPQMVTKLYCTHCGKTLFALMTYSGKLVLCTDCELSSEACIIYGQLELRLTNPVELRILADKRFSGRRVTRLEAFPLVVAQNRYGGMALLSPEEVGRE